MTIIISRFLVVTVIGLLAFVSLQSVAQQPKSLIAFTALMPLLFSSDSRYDQRQPQTYSTPLDQPEARKGQAKQEAATEEHQPPSRRKNINQFPEGFAERERERCLAVVDRLQTVLNTSDDNMILVSDLDETGVQMTWQYGMLNAKTEHDILPLVQAQNNCFQLLTSKINYGDSDRRLILIYNTSRSRSDNNPFMPMHRNGFDLFVLSKHVKKQGEHHKFFLPPPDIFILNNGGQIEEWGNPEEKLLISVNSLLSDWIEEDFDDLFTNNPFLIEYQSAYHKSKTSVDMVNIVKTAASKGTTVERMFTRIDNGRFYITYMYRQDILSTYNFLLNKGFSMRVAITHLMHKHPRFFEKKVHLIVFGNGMKDMPMIRMDMEGEVYNPFDNHLNRLLEERESQLTSKLGVPILSRYELAKMWLVSVIPEGMRRTIREESPSVYESTKHPKVAVVKSAGLTGLLEAMIPYIPSGHLQ